jgi:hypothetical protein
MSRPALKNASEIESAAETVKQQWREIDIKTNELKEAVSAAESLAAVEINDVVAAMHAMERKLSELQAKNKAPSVGVEITRPATATATATAAAAAAARPLMQSASSSSSSSAAFNPHVPKKKVYTPTSADTSLNRNTTFGSNPLNLPPVPTNYSGSGWANVMDTSESIDDVVKRMKRKSDTTTLDDEHYDYTDEKRKKFVQTAMEGRARTERRTRAAADNNNAAAAAAQDYLHARRTSLLTGSNVPIPTLAPKDPSLLTDNANSQGGNMSSLARKGRRLALLAALMAAGQPTAASASATRYGVELDIVNGTDDKAEYSTWSWSPDVTIPNEEEEDDESEAMRRFLEVDDLRRAHAQSKEKKALADLHSAYKAVNDNASSEADDMHALMRSLQMTPVAKKKYSRWL